MAKSSPSCRKKNDRKFYCVNWIQKKLKRLITKQAVVDKRFYLFKKVLSEDSVTRCLHHIPRSGLYPLEERRKYAQDGNQKLQGALRVEFVQFGTKERGSGSQEMVFPEFLLEVASTLGMIDAQLAEHHKWIQHDIGLKVFR